VTSESTMERICTRDLSLILLVGPLLQTNILLRASGHIAARVVGFQYIEARPCEYIRENRSTLSLSHLLVLRGRRRLANARLDWILARNGRRPRNSEKYCPNLSSGYAGLDIETLHSPHATFASIFGDQIILIAQIRALPLRYKGTVALLIPGPWRSSFPAQQSLQAPIPIDKHACRQTPIAGSRHGRLLRPGSTADGHRNARTPRRPLATWAA